MKRGAQRFVLQFATVFAVLAAGNLAVSVYFQPLVGDLTRVGGFAERDYGWNLPQSAISPSRNSVLVSEAEVLVVGDSFSRLLAWQGELERSAGVRTLTFRYDDISSLRNWVFWLEKAKPRPGSIVILQCVERNFVARFRNLGTVSVVAPVPLQPKWETILESRRATNGFEVNIGNNARVLLRALLPCKGVTVTSRGAVNAPLKSAGRFSSRRSDRLLYFHDEELKGEWSEAQLTESAANLREIARRLALLNLRTLVLVMPDKSTVYREDLAEPRFSVVDLASLDLGPTIIYPNLAGRLKAARLDTPDLYLPNDTHLGNSGYKLVAAIVAEAILKK